MKKLKTVWFKLAGSTFNKGKKNRIATADFTKLPIANVVNIVSGFLSAALMIK